MENQIGHVADARWVRECVTKMLSPRVFGLLPWEAARFAIGALSEPHAPDAWRPHAGMTGLPNGVLWFFWRNPSKPDDWHVDQALVENGVIVGKGGCGLDFFTDCQPCRFVDGAEEMIKAALG